MNLKTIAVLIGSLTLVSNVYAVNPGKGVGVSPAEYKLLGATIQNKRTKERLGLVCLDKAGDICKGYRYVEVPTEAGSQLKVLGNNNFEFKHDLNTVEMIDLNEGFLWGNVDYSHFWATERMAASIDDLKNPFESGDPAEGFVSFSTGYGMIFGLGEAAWAGAAVVDFGQVVGMTVVDGLHAVFATPFQALANAARKDRDHRNNKLVRKLGDASEGSDVVVLRAKRYDAIRDAIDNQY